MSRNKRSLITALILLLFAAAFYPLCLRLIAQSYYQNSVNNVREGRYFPAIRDLEKAIHFQVDDPSFWKKLGEAYQGLGKLQSVKEAFANAAKAKEAYRRAFELSPIDAESAFALARGETRLEHLYPFLYPDHDHNPHYALPYFQDAIRLRPNATAYHYAFATYLYYHKKDKEFLSVIRELARMSPLAYNRLRKEQFWSPSVREAVKRGIEKAADEGIDPRNAHSILSSLLAEEKDWEGAISQFKKASLYQPVFNHSGYYAHLGRLFLENRQFEEAGESFIKALYMSETREKDLERLLRIYQNKGYTEGFFQFYEKVRDRFLLSDKTDILLARALMNLKRYNEARQLLNNLNEKKPLAEAYYWLARLANQENDLGAMELAIQKATVHDPGNSRYHLLFSQVLARRQKLSRSEQEAGLAIRWADKPSAALYVNRAQIRWTNKDYAGSAVDWESAISLNPKNVGYFARAADAHEKAGKLSMAMEYYQKAIELNPQHQEYRKRYNAIRQGQGK